jgi:hypothetical protein
MAVRGRSLAAPSALEEGRHVMLHEPRPGHGYSGEIPSYLRYGTPCAAIGPHS